MGSTRPTVGSELFLSDTDKPCLWSHDALWLTKHTPCLGTHGPQDKQNREPYFTEN